MYGKHPSNVAIVEDLAPSALALSSWSCWKVGTLPTSGSADGLSQWTLLTLAKFWFQVSNFFWCDFTVHPDMSHWGRKCETPSSKHHVLRLLEESWDEVSVDKKNMSLHEISLGENGIWSKRGPTNHSSWTIVIVRFYASTQIALPLT